MGASGALALRLLAPAVCCLVVGCIGGNGLLFKSNTCVRSLVDEEVEARGGTENVNGDTGVELPELAVAVEGPGAIGVG